MHLFSDYSNIQVSSFAGNKIHACNTAKSMICDTANCMRSGLSTNTSNGDNVDSVVE